MLIRQETLDVFLHRSGHKFTWSCILGVSTACIKIGRYRGTNSIWDTNLCAVQCMHYLAAHHSCAFSGPHTSCRLCCCLAAGPTGFRAVCTIWSCCCYSAPAAAAIAATTGRGKQGSLTWHIWHCVRAPIMMLFQRRLADDENCNLHSALILYIICWTFWISSVA